MEKENQISDEQDFQWQESFDDIHIHDSSGLQGFFQYRDNEFKNEDNLHKSFEKKQKGSVDQKLVNQTHAKQHKQNEISQYMVQEQESKKINPESNMFKVSKDTRSEKQQIYSKIYRQRKKQRYKSLQEQNEYLKKRINQLQCQIREQEIQLNRFKFPPPQKQFSIEELSKQFVDTSISLVEDLKSMPSEYHKQTFQSDNYFYQFFQKSYAERGFAGSKKVKILNYHFNEILQSLMLDSEKYLSLLFANSKSYDKLTLLPQFQPINKVYQQVYKSDGDLWSRLKTFNKFLFTFSQQFNTHISQFYKKYQDILNSANVIHNFLRDNYLTNMDIARRRLQMEKWFDFYKYGKMMRKLRYQWFQWMKNQALKQKHSTKSERKGSKKKKTSV